jgi:hypothetical protein
MENTPPTTYAATGGASRKPGRGGLILTLGILSLIICGLLGPFAWIMGKGDLQKMDQGLMEERDRGTTKAGMICGIIATILIVCGIAITILYALFVGASSI